MPKSLDELVAGLNEAEAAIRSQHEKAREWQQHERLYMDPAFAWQQVLVTAQLYRRAIDIQREVIDMLGDHIMRQAALAEDCPGEGYDANVQQ